VILTNSCRLGNYGDPCAGETGVLPGWGQDSDKAQTLAAGFNHHFTKPIEPARVSALI
jgi:hypothetical protein